MIPKGYEAYNYQVYGSATNNKIQAFSGSIFTSGSAELSTIRNIYHGSISFISPSVIGDGQNYVSLFWEPDTNTDQMYGAKIGIRKI